MSSDALAVVLAAFLTAMAGPVVVLLVSRLLFPKGVSPEHPETHTESAATDQAIALLMRADFRAQVAEDNATRLRKALKATQEWAVRAAAQIATLGGVPEPFPSKEDVNE